MCTHTSQGGGAARGHDGRYAKTSLFFSFSQNGFKKRLTCRPPARGHNGRYAKTSLFFSFSHNVFIILTLNLILKD
jgi:hypothetical protein